MANQFSTEIGGIFTHVIFGPHTSHTHLKWSIFKVLGTTDSRFFFSVMTSDPSSGFRLVTLICWKQHVSPFTIVTIVLTQKDRNMIYDYFGFGICCSIFLGLTIWHVISRRLFGQRFLGPSWNPDFLTHPHLGPFALDFHSRVLGAQFTIFLLHMYWFGMIIKIGTYYRSLVGNW